MRRLGAYDDTTDIADVQALQKLREEYVAAGGVILEGEE